jgi:hypothetical protein
MCVQKQLGGCGSVPSQIFGIRTFDSFAQAPQNAIVVVPESGTMTTSIHGSNDYTIRHMGKEALLRAGTLPVSIVPSATALEVLDMLEKGREPVVNNDNIVENNDAAVVQMIRKHVRSTS